MGTRLWFGRQLGGYEAKALQSLQRELDGRSIDAHLLANFEVGGHEIDLLVVKRDGIFLIEIKKVGGPVRGAVNGVWTVQNGQADYPLPGGGGENPYQQMRTQYRVLTEWLESHKSQFLAPDRLDKTRFRPLRHQADDVARAQIRSLLAFYPTLPAASRLDIGWPVEPVSFADLVVTLRRPTKRVNLAEEEMVALAEALHLTPAPEQRGAVLSPAAVQALQPVAPRLSPVRVWLRIQLMVVQFVLVSAVDWEGRLLRRLTIESKAPARPAVLVALQAPSLHRNDRMLASLHPELVPVLNRTGT